MIPESYRIAYAALDAVWQRYPTDSLAILLGGMAILESDETSMNPACLDDWEQTTLKPGSTNQLELILNYLELDASRFRNVPDDLRHLIDALRTEGSQERKVVESVIATRHERPESWALYAELTRQQPQSEEPR
jgi:hypothetical protein